MRVLFIFSLLVLSFAKSMNGYGQETPEEYSARLQAATISIYSGAALWGSTFIEQMNGNQEYDRLTKPRKELQAIISKKLKEFSKTEDISGSERLNTALLAFLNYESELVKTGFEPFEKLSANTSEEQMAACRERLKTEAAKERALTDALNDERRAYARKNGFSLEPPAEERKPISRPAPRAAPKTTVTPKPAQRPKDNEEREEEKKDEDKTMKTGKEKGKEKEKDDEDKDED
ncbi:MAG: hypothetical protein H7257_07860 [Taibaiella sp.]|nr:hypothetical protein [Taibaiella sp.]